MNVCFITFSDRDSTPLLGEQPADALGADHFDGRLLDNTDIEAIRDRVIVFIKRCPWDRDVLEGLKDRGCKIIVDLADLYPVGGKLFHPDLIDALITRCTADEGYFIPHHWDPRVENKRQDKIFKLGYFGDWKWMLHLELVDINCSRHSFAEQLEYMSEASCHYAVRSLHDANNIPGTKVALAAGCGVPLIATRLQAYLDVLPQDYPLFTDDASVTNVTKVVDYAKGIFGTKDWNHLQSVMAEVKHVTDIRNQIPLYRDLFDRVVDGERLVDNIDSVGIQRSTDK